jgi:hypothetical protein
MTSNMQPSSSPKHHLNVYKPTFINQSINQLNGAIINTVTNENQLLKGGDLEIVEQISKKYRPSSKQGHTYSNNTNNSNNGQSNSQSRQMSSN